MPLMLSVITRSGGFIFWILCLSLFFGGTGHSQDSRNCPNMHQAFGMLNRVYDLYSHKKYKKARQELDWSTTIIDKCEDYYPYSVGRYRKTLDGQIKDKMGVFKKYPRVSGVIVDQLLGPYWAIITIKTPKKVMEFDVDTGTVAESHYKKGSRITVYYQDIGRLRAVKIIVHRL